MVERVEAEEVDSRGADAILGGVDGILVPGGFGMRGIEGKIEAIRYARMERIPYFGICLGMQCAVVEFARNELGLKDANSTEFDPDTAHPVIAMMEEQQSVQAARRHDATGCLPVRLDRLAAWPTRPTPPASIQERHRHRYELNNDYRKAFHEAGLVATGISPDGTIVEIMERLDIPGSSRCSSTPNSNPSRPRPTRSSATSSRPRSSGGTRARRRLGNAHRPSRLAWRDNSALTVWRLPRILLDSHWNANSAADNQVSPRRTNHSEG